jgi:hypothetical protein
VNRTQVLNVEQVEAHGLVRREHVHDSGSTIENVPIFRKRRKLEQRIRFDSNKHNTKSFDTAEFLKRGLCRNTIGRGNADATTVAIETPTVQWAFQLLVYDSRKCKVGTHVAAKTLYRSALIVVGAKYHPFATESRNSGGPATSYISGTADRVPTIWKIVRQSTELPVLTSGRCSIL